MSDRARSFNHPIPLWPVVHPEDLKPETACATFEGTAIPADGVAALQKTVEGTMRAPSYRSTRISRRRTKGLCYRRSSRTKFVCTGLTCSWSGGVCPAPLTPLGLIDS